MVDYLQVPKHSLPHPVPTACMGVVYFSLMLGLDMWLAIANGMSENIRQVESMNHAYVVGLVLCTPSCLHEITMHPGGWETGKAKLDLTRSPVRAQACSA